MHYSILYIYYKTKSINTGRAIFQDKSQLSLWLTFQNNTGYIQLKYTNIWPIMDMVPSQQHIHEEPVALLTRRTPEITDNDNKYKTTLHITMIQNNY